MSGNNWRESRLARFFMGINEALEDILMFLFDDCLILILLFILLAGMIIVGVILIGGN